MRRDERGEIDRGEERKIGGGEDKNNSKMKEKRKNGKENSSEA